MPCVVSGKQPVDCRPTVTRNSLENGGRSGAIRLQAAGVPELVHWRRGLGAVGWSMATGPRLDLLQARISFSFFWL